MKSHWKEILCILTSVCLLFYFFSFWIALKNFIFTDECNFSVQQRLQKAEEIWQRDFNKKFKALKNGRPGSIEIWDFVYPSFSCPFPIERFGRIGDGGKWICGFNEILKKKESCMIYSFGISSDTSFEEEVIEHSENCVIKMFDHTIEKPPPIVEKYPGKAMWYQLGIGGADSVKLKTLKTLLAENNDDFLDIIKIDIEGNEFEALDQILKDFKNVLPFSQLLIEIHLQKPRERFKIQETERIQNFLTWWNKLELGGLRIFQKELNYDIYINLMKFCEFSLLNINNGPFELIE